MKSGFHTGGFHSTSMTCIFSSECRVITVNSSGFRVVDGTIPKFGGLGPP